MRERDSHVALVITSCVLGLAAFALIMVAVVACRKYRRKRRLYQMQFEQLMRSPRQSFSSEEPANDQPSALPYDAAYDLSRADVSFGQTLGEGTFGVIYAGKVLKSGGEYPVAIKCPRSDSCQDKQVLMDELKVLIYVGAHPNVLGLVGSVRENFLHHGQLLLVVQLCELGDMHTFLRQFNAKYNGGAEADANSLSKVVDSESGSVKMRFVNEIARFENNGYVEAVDSGCANANADVHRNWRSLSTIYKAEVIPGWEKEAQSGRSPATSLLTCDLLSFALQTAVGMQYLADKQIIHRDLAARNLLLTDKFTVKISDFGLSRRRAQHTHYYAMQNALKIKLPLKWTAVECLQPPFKFSTKSDVWSFGVTMWEMFSLCDTPYAHAESPPDRCFNSASELYEFIYTGERLPWSSSAPSEVYTLMDECWQMLPADRPDFAKCIDFLAKQLARCSKQLLNVSPKFSVEPRKSSAHSDTTSHKKSSRTETIVHYEALFPTPYTCLDAKASYGCAPLLKRCMRRSVSGFCARDSNWLCAFLSLLSAVALVCIMGSVIVVHNTSAGHIGGCTAGTIRCADGSKCVQSRFRCDGHKDCGDGSDEFNCTAAECTGFMCDDGERCLSTSHRCNGAIGCVVDGSDERNCTEEECTGFLCVDGEKCIAKHKRCNGLRGCPADGSDERNCTKEQCTGFLCADGSVCTTSRRRCNGDPLCPDESDELNCTECQPGAFLCANGRCIVDRRRCDGARDCEDGSDEADCNMSTTREIFGLRRAHTH